MKICWLSLCILLSCLFIECHEFPYDPPKDFHLYNGLGNLHHPVSTKSFEAQSFFNQGLTLIYAFNHDAAYWSFKKAAEIDPQLAMAYWGMALALGPNINMDIDFVREKKAHQSIQTALKLMEPISTNEQDYIKALATRYTNTEEPNLKQLALEYSLSMEKVVKKYPDDPDAAALYAESVLDLNPWHQWTLEGAPLKGTQEIVNLLEKTLKWNPNHLGANHYYIHAIEASNHPERALMSAQRLSKMLPASGHILHMPSHIYLLVGDYHAAALANEKAVKADQDYINAFGLDGIYPLHYMTHNLYFLSRAYSLEGRYQEARQAADKLRCFYSPHFNRMPELEYYEPSVMFVLLRFHQWDEMLKQSSPPEKMKISLILWHFGRALAFSALGKQIQAEQERTIFMEEKSKIPPDAIYGYNQAHNILKIAEYQLNAKIAEKNENLKDAIEWLQKAVQIQEHLYYNEPPDWYFPLRETLGALLLANQQPEQAELVFREDLEKHPRNGRSLFGLWKSLEAQKKFTDAFYIQQAFHEAWKYSDTPLNLNDL